MNEDAISQEIISPAGLGEELIRLGLEPISLTEEEFFLAEDLGLKYQKISHYDCIALAIAKCRRIVLLTGDAALRKAAEKESVTCVGTIWLLDELFQKNCISKEEYLTSLHSLSSLNGRIVSLPESALKERIEMCLKDSK